jgi:hypothetical protein
MRRTILVLGMLPALLAAAEIYKSVDGQGRVTYSTAPPQDAVASESVDVAPGPSDSEQREAQQRVREMEAAAGRLNADAARRQAATVKARQQAQERVGKAEAELQEAMAIKDSDWLPKAGGGRRLNPAYEQRVEEARQRLQSAQKGLSEAQRDSR